jgi:mycothiol synthase
VALCLAGVDAEANDREGTADMWLERVGTIPSRQRQGLATTLLLQALRAGTAAGMTRAGLTVDEDGTSGATALYERLGFTAERRTLAFVKDVA